MKARHILASVLTLVVSLFYSPFASARTYTVTAAGDRLEFVPQLQKGYVIKLAERTAGIRALAGLSALDAEDAREVRGLDRRGVYTVENEGPAGRNEDTIRSLRAGGQVAYAAPLFSSNGETVAIIPEIVVRVKPDTDFARVEALCGQAGCRIKKRMEFTEQEYLLNILGPDADAVFAAVEQLSQAPEIEWACPNMACRPKLGSQVAPVGAVAEQAPRIASAGEDPNTAGVFPNDPYFPKQWHLHNTGQSGGTPGADIRAPEAWEITTGDPNIVIAVVDNGVDSRHPDLTNNLVSGYDFYGQDDQPEPALDQHMNAHGTGCAGLIAACGNNEIGLSGVTWDCRVMSVRSGCVLSSGTEAWITQEGVATAFRWAATHGADIVSSSWGWSTSPTPILHSGIVDVTKVGGLGRDGKGCVVLFAAGNNSARIASYPAKYPEVIVVGATDHNDVRWSYSDYGPELDIVAPSGSDLALQRMPGDIWTTDLVGPPGWNNRDAKILDYADSFGGTSATSPIAAGVVALILSVEPNLTNDEVRHFLDRSAKDLGDPGRDDYYGWGRVDARAALDMVLAKRADLNNDWKVDEQDLAILNAAIDANDLSADIAPAKKRDRAVDANDRELLTRYLGTVIPELGLIAHWKLDETEGLAAYDGVNHRDDTLHGGAIWQPAGGRVDGAIELDGADDYVSTGYVLNPSAGAFSVFVWVKGRAPGQVILSQASGRDWLSAEAGTGTLMTGLTAGRVFTLSSQAVITDGEWHRVGVSWDGASLVLYANDVEVARKAQGSPPGSTVGLYMGAGSKLAAGTFWSGLIDDVRIYDRAVKP